MSSSTNTNSENTTIAIENVTLKFNAEGLLPVIVQDNASGQVLMLAYANQEAITKTLDSGEAHYYSRSRQELWHKGATSGHVQHIDDVRFDCDADAVLYTVKQTGAACHTGEYSCFYRSLAGLETKTGSQTEKKTTIGEMMSVLEHTINSRYTDMPEGSYVAKLHNRGQGYIAQKVVEEAGETIVAALLDNHEEMAKEAADLLFHLGVLLKEKGVGWQEVANVLADRHDKKE